MRFTVLMFRGIGEQLRTGDDILTVNMLANLAKYLPHNFDLVDVPWSATYGPAGSLMGTSYDHSLDDAVRLGYEYSMQLSREGTPFFVVGYSGGAAGASKLVNERLSNNEYLGGVGLVANPNSPGDITDYSSKHGVSGRRIVKTPEGVPVWDLADPDDVIPRCEFPSPIRTFCRPVEGILPG